jgi:cyclase
MVCTGDMITEPVPFGYSRFPLDWANTLKQVAALEFDTLIPGHGEVQRGKSYLQSVITLLESVQNQVRNGIAQGKDLDAVRKQVDLTSIERQFGGDDPVNRYYFHEYFVLPNVERTFNQLRAVAPK